MPSLSFTIAIICNRPLPAHLLQAYKIFDVNQDGKVVYKEFVEALKKLDLGLTDAMVRPLHAHHQRSNTALH